MGDTTSIDALLELDAKRRTLVGEIESMRSERNAVSKAIPSIKDPAEKQIKISEMRALGDRLAILEKEGAEIDALFDTAMLSIPNIPSDETPDGEDDSANQVTGEFGVKPQFGFQPKTHWEIGEATGLIDFERGTKISGTRFYILKGELARLQRALISFMLDVHTREHGFIEVYPPFMVKEHCLYGTGQLPKFGENLYHDAEEDFWFVPTAEVPVTNMYRDEILDGAGLPLVHVAYTACFRREKMSAGKDVRGIKRGHQFDKVEMYTYCKPEDSMKELEKMLGDAEQTCRELGLTYRIVQLCTGDLGFNSAVSFDVEVWAPGCGEWLEVSSVSNVTDFQARRANIKYKDEDGRKEYLHTLNGSGLGMPRTLIAVMETYQQADGSIKVPDVLKPWMGGIDVITREE